MRTFPWVREEQIKNSEGTSVFFHMSQWGGKIHSTNAVFYLHSYVILSRVTLICHRAVTSVASDFRSHLWRYVVTEVRICDIWEDLWKIGIIGASLVAQVVKNPPANAKDIRSDPWVGKIPWRMAWQPTPVFLPGESHGQRSQAGYSPWCCKELDTTEVLCLSLKWLSM